jgi:hypothetical protein
MKSYWLLKQVGNIGTIGIWRVEQMVKNLIINVFWCIWCSYWNRKEHESRTTLERRSVPYGGINLEARSDCGWRVEWSHVLGPPLISPPPASTPFPVSSWSLRHSWWEKTLTEACESCRSAGPVAWGKEQMRQPVRTADIDKNVCSKISTLTINVYCQNRY